jgi:glutaredoxin 3
VPPRIVIHGTQYCGYCRSAERLLKQRQIDFEYVDVSGNREARHALYRKTGRTSVPQIWIGERWIGGFDELEALDESGELARLISASS